MEFTEIGEEKRKSKRGLVAERKRDPDGLMMRRSDVDRS